MVRCQGDACVAPTNVPCRARGVVPAPCVAVQGHQSGRAFGDRRSSRLPKYDYASRGPYFVTICARNMECVFGVVGSDGQMTLNEWGHVAESCWLAIPEHFPGIALDMRITMPNHLHGILAVDAWTQKSQSRIRRPSLGMIVGSIKAAVTRRIREMTQQPDETVWQRNFYEHIIRDEDDLQRIRRYIETNPTRWAQRPRRS